MPNLGDRSIGIAVSIDWQCVEAIEIKLPVDKRERDGWIGGEKRSVTQKLDERQK